MKATAALEEALQTFQSRWHGLLAQKKQDGEEMDVSNEIIAGNLDVFRLKGLLSTGFDELEALKEELSKTREGLDLTSLQLQNQLYEKSYYEKEIEACYNFK